MRDTRARKLTTPAMRDVIGSNSASTHRLSGTQSQLSAMKLRSTGKNVEPSPTRRSKTMRKLHSVRKWWYLPQHLESTASFRWRWDILMLLLLFYTAIMVPYEIAFVTGNEVDALFVIDFIVDILFGLDIVFNFFTPVVDKTTNAIVDEFPLIAKQYLRGWFTIDLASIFPFEMFSSNDADSTAPPSNSLVILRILRVLRIMKLMRVFRANRIVARWQARLDFPIALSKLFAFAMGVLVLAHWFACLWGCTPQFEHYVDPETGLPLDWTTDNGVASKGPTTLYIASLYWSIMTISTIGYGDITMTTALEKVVAILCMVVGCGSYSFIIGSICGLVSGLSEATNEFNQKMDHLNMYMAKEELPQEMKIMLREYFLHMRDQMHHKYFAHALDTLSPGLRGEIEVYTSGEWIHRIPFFVGGPTSQHIRFVTAITQRLEPMLYPPNEVLIHSGDATDVMYIISRGLVARLGRLFGKGHFVGEDIVLNNGIRHYEVRTLTYVDTLALRRDDLNCVLDQGTFPFKKARIRRASALLAIARKMEYLLDELRYLRKSPEYNWTPEQECEWFRTHMFNKEAATMLTENRSVVHAIKNTNQALAVLERIASIDDSIKDRDDFYAVSMSIKMSLTMLNDAMHTVPGPT
ncbi:voltage-gated ion channel superfamily [Achlya hypogyna]|uniref:Voltage-gated ion channel superfamily n=1 Tax=Achlya hypogyna TaxID=1202772 RepID=A0A1V9YBT9_ACHHY|nr:voltage-gated ion channel superfamily [Achlya hypogyna]